MEKNWRPFFFCSSPKKFTKKRCFIEFFENIPFWFFPQIVLIDRNHSTLFAWKLSKYSVLYIRIIYRKHFVTIVNKIQQYSLYRNLGCHTNNSKIRGNQSEQFFAKNIKKYFSSKTSLITKILKIKGQFLYKIK